MYHINRQRQATKLLTLEAEKTKLVLAAEKNGRITNGSSEDVVCRHKGGRYTTLLLQPLGPTVHGRCTSQNAKQENKINGYINS